MYLMLSEYLNHLAEERGAFGRVLHAAGLPAPASLGLL